MPQKTDAVVASTIGIDTGKNTLHLVGLDDQGTIVLREKLSRSRIASRLANVPRGIPVRQGLRFLRQQLPEILAKRIDVLSPRMIRIIEDLSGEGGISMSASSMSPKRSKCWHMAPRVAGS
jgi:hypothetical protein